MLRRQQFGCHEREQYPPVKRLKIGAFLRNRASGPSAECPLSQFLVRFRTGVNRLPPVMDSACFRKNTALSDDLA